MLFTIVAMYRPSPSEPWLPIPPINYQDGTGNISWDCDEAELGVFLRSLILGDRGDINRGYMVTPALVPLD